MHDSVAIIFVYMQSSSIYPERIGKITSRCYDKVVFCTTFKPPCKGKGKPVAPDVLS
jgi:hypothetical protein